MTNSVVELLDSLVRDAEEALCSSLLGLLVGQVPDSILERELLVEVADLGQETQLEIL